MNERVKRVLRCWFRLLRQANDEHDNYMYVSYEHKLYGASEILHLMGFLDTSQYDKFKNAVLSNYRNCYK
jgi:hypothetical protein